MLTVLGSGTLVPDARRYSAAHLVALSSANVLLDCGPGTLHGMATHGVAWPALTHIALSHFHNDHVGDLGAVMMALKRGLPTPRAEPLLLLGPPGLRAFLERLSEALGRHVLDPGFPVEVIELGPGGETAHGGSGLRIGAHPTPHTTESVALRVESPDGVFGYTGDTGPSNEVAAFLRGCHVLVAECTLPVGATSEGHLAPDTLARLAAAARPDLLLVTHVAPGQTPDEAVLAVRSGYEGRVLAARDGLRVTLGPDGPAVDPAPTAVYT